MHLVPSMSSTFLRNSPPFDAPHGGGQNGGNAVPTPPPTSSQADRRRSPSAAVLPPTSVADALNIPTLFNPLPPPPVLNNLQPPQAPSLRPQAEPVGRPARRPSNLQEWQLFAVLQRANLIQYYDTFIAQGGDDVNQLLQSDESEFLEIMQVVGMVNKPLHVRRLQHALQEYSRDVQEFQMIAARSIGPPPPPLYNFPPFPGFSNIGLRLPSPAPAAATNGQRPGSANPDRMNATQTPPVATANVTEGDPITSFVIDVEAPSLADQPSTSKADMAMEVVDPTECSPVVDNGDSSPSTSN